MQQNPLLKVNRQPNVELVVGEKVSSLLSSIDFLHSWDALYHACLWATVYQGKEFVSTWYEIYRDKYFPIIVRETTDGKLTGLVTLARNKKGEIVGAGASQAEYQVWLSQDDNGSFIKNAITVIKQQFHGSDIQLRFVPAETPLNWIENDHIWKKRC